MIRFVFKWAFRLFLLGVVTVVILVVAFFLSLDSIVRIVAEHNIRAQTGMDAEIGHFHVGILEPVVSIHDLKIYNSPAYGGTLLLDIPEIHAEYDRDALRHQKIHLTLLRFNLGEVDIVKNEAGRTNLFDLGVTLPARGVTAPVQASASASAAEFKRQTGLTFQQIDVLTVSVGKARYIDLKDQRHNREQKIDIENLPIRNVKSAADLAGLGVLIALRSGDFFSSLVLPPGTR